MHNGNGRPALGKKKTIRLMVALTLLAWATQTLMSQWGFGGEPLAADAPATIPSDKQLERAAQERFVPGTARFAAGATIELRSEATIVGEDVKLRQIARWNQQDEAVLGPLGELVLARLGAGTPFRGIGVVEVKETLRSAGINIASLNFVGATSCTVSRSDVEYDERIALQQWIEARETIAAGPAQAPASAPARAEEQVVQAMADPQSVRTLRNLLTTDLAQRLALPADSLQMSFKQQDQRLLNLAEPMFRFEIEPMRAKNLGEVSWLVLIIADHSERAEDVQKATITANARAWQMQLVVSKPLAMKQVIRDEDVIERRSLVERLPDEPLVARAEVIGQQAARPLAAGTVLTARSIEAQQLVKSGQYVTITLQQGGVNLKTVAKALESGSYGQIIRVKNESTRDVFQVVLTGPQTATMNLSHAPTNANTTTDPENIASAGN